ncbi:hypothetical protein F5Y16DRAFT_364300 [Xylariaceae sp. FL0255]|nr:hypothetical protein F5Y16DRAFT_364300 [Xylariaceae sp. FL0255]
MFSTSQHSSAQVASIWEQNKGIFRRLYQDEKKTLKEVKTIMERDFGFPTTPLSTYEYQLRDQLGLRVKVKRSEWHAVYQEVHKRRERRSAVYLNGSKIPPMEAWRKIRRSGATSQSLDQAYALPPDIVVRTPSPDPQSPALPFIGHHQNNLSLRYKINPAAAMAEDQVAPSLAKAAWSESGNQNYQLSEFYRTLLKDLPSYMMDTKIAAMMSVISSETISDSYQEFQHSSCKGLFYDHQLLRPFHLGSRSVTSNLDSHSYLSRLMFSLANEPNQMRSDPKSIARLLPHALLPQLLKSECQTFRAAFEGLVDIAFRKGLTSEFSALVEIGMRQRPGWMTGPGRRYIIWAAILDCFDAYQNLLSASNYFDMDNIFCWTNLNEHMDAIVGSAMRNGHCTELIIQQLKISGAKNKIQLIFVQLVLIIAKNQPYKSHNGSNCVWPYSGHCYLHPNDHRVQKILTTLMKHGAHADIPYLEYISTLSFIDIGNTESFYRRNEVTNRFRLTLLEVVFYADKDLYHLLASGISESTIGLTRLGICLASAQSGFSLQVYVDDHIHVYGRAHAKMLLDLVLAEQFQLNQTETSSAIIQCLLEYGAVPRTSPSQKDFGYLLLNLIFFYRRAGVSQGSRVLLDIILQKGASIYPETIAAAVERSGTSILQLLTQAGIDCASHGGLALSRAARLDNYEAVEWLLNKGVNVNGLVLEREKKMSIVFHMNCRTERKLLPPVHRNDNLVILEHESRNPASYAMLRHLVKKGALLRPNHQCSSAHPILLGILNDGNVLEESEDKWHQDRIEKVRFLLTSGAGLQSISKVSQCAYEACCLAGNSENMTDLFGKSGLAIFRLLLAHKLPFQPRSGALAALIKVQAPISMIETVLAMGIGLNKSAGTDSPSDWRRTPIQAAAAIGSLQVAKKLKIAGANINSHAKGYHGRTALQAACAMAALTEDDHTQKMEMVKWLLASGAEINAPRSLAGYTALQFAVEYSTLDIVLLLLDHGANVNNSSKDVYLSALDLSAAQGRLDCTTLLLNLGAVSSNRFRTDYDEAISQAEMNNHWAIVELLSKRAKLWEGVEIPQELFEYEGTDSSDEDRMEA